MTGFNFEHITYHGYPLGIVVRKQLAHRHIFRIVRGRQDKYDYVVPSNPRKPKQQHWRQVLAMAVSLWKDKTDEEKALWNESARRARYHYGYVYFVSAYLETYRILHNMDP